MKTWVAVLLTVLYLGAVILIILLRGDVWDLLRKGELNVLGGFLAGVFAPLVFIWMICGHLLQKEKAAAERDWRQKQANMERRQELRSLRRPIIESDVLERLNRVSD